jgi:flagellar assembly factor FliW
MKITGTIEMENPAAPAPNQVRLPLGILGFEQIKNYILLADPAEKPFAWLRVADNSTLAFVVADPLAVRPDYRPDIPQADAEFLGLKDADDALLLGIVTVHARNRATMNLKGPVVINRRTRTGKQVIIANAAEYSVEQPLPLAEPGA